VHEGAVSVATGCTLAICVVWELSVFIAEQHGEEDPGCVEGSCLQSLFHYPYLCDSNVCADVQYHCTADVVLATCRIWLSAAFACIICLYVLAAQDESPPDFHVLVPL
jgi:hypothetical protein